MCATATVRKLRKWSARWVHAALFNVHGSSAEDLHDTLLADTGLAEEEAHGRIRGGRQDLSQCFDRVSPVQAIGVLRRFGLSNELCNLMEKFYVGRKVFFEAKGAVCADAALPITGVLAGFPFSVMMVDALQTLWARLLDRKAPSVRRGSFLDDRQTWATNQTAGTGATSNLLVAARETKKFDDAIGAVNAEKKAVSFSAGQGEDDRTEDEEAEFIGTMGHDEPYVDILGVTHAFGKGEIAEPGGRVIAYARAFAECNRVAKVIHHGNGKRSARDRRVHFIKQLVMPKAKWAMAVTQPNPKVLNKLRGAIEAAIRGVSFQMEQVIGKMNGIRGHLPGRSAGLFWGKYLEVHPDMQKDLMPFEAERRRLRRRDVVGAHQAAPQRHSRATARLRETIAKWGWTNLGQGRFQTREGTLDVTRDSKAAISMVTRLASVRAFWRTDARANDVDQQLAEAPGFECASSEALALGYAYDKVHHEMQEQKGMDLATLLNRLTAVGAAPDDRWFCKDGGGAKANFADLGINFKCECGGIARRRHWLGDCVRTASQRENLQRPTAPIELGLALPIIRLPAAAQDDAMDELGGDETNDDLHEQLVQILRTQKQEAESNGQRLLCIKYIF